jgi:hypothetical protein
MLELFETIIVADSCPIIRQPRPHHQHPGRMHNSIELLGIVQFRMHAESPIEPLGNVFDRDVVVKRNIVPNIQVDRLDRLALFFPVQRKAA